MLVNVPQINVYMNILPNAERPTAARVINMSKGRVKYVHREQTVFFRSDAIRWWFPPDAHCGDCTVVLYTFISVASTASNNRTSNIKRNYTRSKGSQNYYAQVYCKLSAWTREHLIGGRGAAQFKYVARTRRDHRYRKFQIWKST